MNKNLPGKSKTPLQLKLFHTLIGLGVFFSLITVPAESQVINLFGMYVPSQLLWWPEVFFIFYIIHSVYGFSYLRHSVYLLILFRIIYLLFLKLAIYLPSASFWTMQATFKQVLGRDWLYIIVSSMLIWSCTFIPYKILHTFKSVHLSCVYGISLIFFTLISSLLTQEQPPNLEFYVLVTVVIYSLLLLISTSLIKTIIRLEQFTPQDINYSIFKFGLPSKILNSNKFFKYHHILFCSSVVFFIASKTMASKFIAIGSFTINVGGIVFSLAYLASDMMTDVYGIERTKQMIFFVLFCNLLFVFDIWLTNLLAINDHAQFKVILHNQTRIFIASAIAFFLGMIINSSAISIIKSRQRWRRIALKKEFLTTVWTRIATSSSVGIILDVSLFSLVAFYGMVPSEKLASIILFEDIYKISYEVLLAPVSVLLIYLLKVTEKVDIYDERANLNPFKININYQFSANKFYENYKQTVRSE